MPNRRFLTGWLTDFTAGSYPPRWTVAGEAIWLVDAGASMATRVALALINVNFTLLPWVDKWGCVHERKESSVVHILFTKQKCLFSNLPIKSIVYQNLIIMSLKPGRHLIYSCSDWSWYRFSPRYPGGQAQDTLSPAVSQRPPFWQCIFRHGSL